MAPMFGDGSQGIGGGGLEAFFGYIPMPAESAVYAATLPEDNTLWDELREADDGGDRFNYRALAYCLRNAGLSQWLAQIDGYTRIRSYAQGSIGSCVGNAEAKRAAYMAALDICLRLEPEEFRAMFSPEASYGLSREKAGLLGRGDGSTGYGAAQAATDVGVVPQGVYGDQDLRVYNVTRCREYGRRGCPEVVRQAAAPHRAKQYVKVDTAEKVWLLAGAGIAINQCSSIGWAEVQSLAVDGDRLAVGLVAGQDRDDDGALKRRGSWNHSMCVGGARRTTKAGRKLVLIDQSWGDDWVGGGYYLDQPAGSFYADLDDVARAVAQGDTYADLGYGGFARAASRGQAMRTLFTEM